MNRARFMPRFCFVATAVLTLCGVILRTICMLTQFDAEIGYFNEGFLPTLCRALYFVAAIVAVIGASLIPKGVLPVEWHIPHRLPMALVLGASLALFTVAMFITMYSAILSFGHILHKLLAVLGLLGSTYFFVSANRQGKYPDRLSALALLPLLWSMMGVAETYSDQLTTMNSPVKLALQMGFVGFMFILIAELRFRLQKTPAPRSAVALMSIGVFLCLNGSLPILVAMGAIHQTLHLLYAAVLLCAGLYGGYMLLCYTCFSEPVSAEPEDSELSDTPSPELDAD